MADIVRIVTEVVVEDHERAAAETPEAAALDIALAHNYLHDPNVRVVDVELVAWA